MAVAAHNAENGAHERRLMTRREYARHRGVEFYAVRLAIQQGRIGLVHGKIDPEEADRDWAANTMEEKGGDAGLARHAVGDAEATGTLSPPTFNSVRTRHEQLRLELTQAELEERRGNLLRRDEVERATFARFRRVRDAVLRVPVQLAAAVAANTDPAECRRVMNDALRDALLGEGADA